jgi:outer membrane protein TolC
MRQKMKHMTKYLTIILAVMTGFAESSGQQYRDSLSGYLEIAAGNNPEVLQRFAEYEAALKKVPQVASLPDPQLDMGIFITPMELIGGNQVADLRLMQMFPWFGVLKNAKDEMSLMAMAKFELLRETRLQVSYEVRTAWYELYRIRRSIDISRRNLEILKVIEQLSLIRYMTPSADNQGDAVPQSGMQTSSSVGPPMSTNPGMPVMPGPIVSRGSSSQGQGTGRMQSGSMNSSTDGFGLTDLYRIKIEAGDLENGIALLENMEQTVRARLNSYLNRPPLQEIFTGDTLLPDTLSLNSAAISDSVQKNSPMLSMISYEQESFQARKRMVTRMGYPMVGLGINYSVIGKSEMAMSTMNGKDMIMPMVSVSLPIYRKKYTAMKEEADLMSKASSESYKVVSGSLNAELYSALQLYRDARRRVSLFEDQSELASKSLEIMLKSYSASSVPLTDVLRVMQQSLDYETKQVEAVTDLNTAAAWLKRLMADPNNH